MSSARDAPSRRRIHPAWFLVAAFAVFLVVREYRASAPADAVYCDEKNPPGAGQVTMLSAAWCPYCAKTRHWLIARDVPYCEWDIERSATGAARYAAAPLKVVPQIFVADRVLIGFDAEELARALAAHGLLPQRPAR